MSLAVGRARSKAVCRQLARSKLVEIDLRALCHGARRRPHHQSQQRRGRAPRPHSPVIPILHASLSLSPSQRAQASASRPCLTLFAGKWDWIALPAHTKTLSWPESCVKMQEERDFSTASRTNCRADRFLGNPRMSMSDWGASERQVKRSPFMRRVFAESGILQSSRSSVR